MIYVADTLHAPYGEKSIEFITKRVNTIAQQLVKQNVKALVIACNTATVNAIEQLREQLSIPIIGVEPAIKPAAKHSQTKKVAVLVTQATSENQRFKELISTHHNGAEVFIQPCPGLVENIEQGEINSDACMALLRQYIEPLLAKKVDTIVLGCTHYPFLQQQIAAIARQVHTEVNIIETAAPVTVQLNKKLIEANLSATSSQQVEHLFFSSKAGEKQQQLFSQLWHDEIQLRLFDY